jgi:PAS domain-containing protein
MNTKFTNDRHSSENTPVDAAEVKTRDDLLMELSGDGIIMVQDGIIRECNRSMAQMCGCHTESMRDSALAEYFPPEENPGMDTLAGSITFKSDKPQVQTANPGMKNRPALKSRNHGRWVRF